MLFRFPIPWDARNRRFLRIGSPFSITHNHKCPALSLQRSDRHVRAQGKHLCFLKSVPRTTVTELLRWGVSLGAPGRDRVHYVECSTMLEIEDFCASVKDFCLWDHLLTSHQFLSK
ncbi:MAG: hypothetical protein AB4426_27170 [Xenococcaceae cyanobacterium]